MRFNYAMFVNDFIVKIAANQRYNDVARRGTQTDKIRLLFDVDPALKRRSNIHLLLMAYWVAYDATTEFGRIPDATPAESITRIRRYVLEAERNELIDNAAC